MGNFSLKQKLSKIFDLSSFVNSLPDSPEIFIHSIKYFFNKIKYLKENEIV